jgi:Domain of unknown function (DUF5753)
MAEDRFDPAVSPQRVFGAMPRFYRTRSGLSQTDPGARLHFSGDLLHGVRRVIEPGHQRRAERTARAHEGGDQERGAAGLVRGLAAQGSPGPVPALVRAGRDPGPAADRGVRAGRAVLWTQVMATEDQVEDMVRARMERQLILIREHPPMFRVILDEGVLRRPVGGRPPSTWTPFPFSQVTLASAARILQAQGIDVEVIFPSRSLAVSN